MLQCFVLRFNFVFVFFSVSQVCFLPMIFYSRQLLSSFRGFFWVGRVLVTNTRSIHLSRIHCVADIHCQSSTTRIRITFLSPRTYAFILCHTTLSHYGYRYAWNNVSFLNKHYLNLLLNNSKGGSTICSYVIFGRLPMIFFAIIALLSLKSNSLPSIKRVPPARDFILWSEHQQFEKMRRNQTKNVQETGGFLHGIDVRNAEQKKIAWRNEGFAGEKKRGHGQFRRVCYREIQKYSACGHNRFGICEFSCIFLVYTHKWSDRQVDNCTFVTSVPIGWQFPLSECQ